MKIYSIGRDINCNIVIDDNTDVISRRHATLNVSSSGKMTIVDQSHNGTYVNGIRIASNQPVPVTRKDNVSFAHVARLDWNTVPKPISPMVWAAIAVAAVLLVLGIIFGLKALNGGSEGTDNKPDQTLVPDSAKVIELTPQQVKAREDSIKNATIKAIQDEAEKKRINDSIDQETAKKVEQARIDSISKARADSIAKVKKQQKAQQKKKDDKKADEDAKKQEPAKKKQF
ncbi:MAG: FHA domain-containing protein [Prevotella sp.]|nr:FHA domain-containing protein [Prevotella sp.]